MTTAYQIIVDAYRQSNLLAIGVEPTQIQESEALRYLNRLLKSVYGNEVGEALTGFPIGRTNISKPAGFPWWETVPDSNWFVPKNTRVNFNLEIPGVNLYLHPIPNDGSRFAALDVGNTLFDNPVTVHGNGFLINGQESIVLSEDGFDGEWMFRTDTGNWIQYSPLTLFDPFPFPEEFDDYFILMLAFRLNPAYERQLDPQSQVVLQRSRTQLRARYTQDIFTRSELGLTRNARTTQDRDRWGGFYGDFDPTALFNSGRPW